VLRSGPLTLTVAATTVAVFAVPAAALAAGTGALAYTAYSAHGGAIAGRGRRREGADAHAAVVGGLKRRVVAGRPAHRLLGRERLERQ
jgi:hypothetical protein